ncbi:hypothetical protein I4U23_009516 [Adineta vaga]|nr:hypothetical protein I4U23_009516 [Adineta vaga]
MNFGLLFFLFFILSSIISSIATDGLFQHDPSNTNGNILQKLRRKASTKYRNLKTKFSNNNPRYQPPIVPSDTSQKRLVNQANTNNITHATDNNIYSTSTIAEDYCQNFGPTSSVFLFAYRGSCYSLTNQAVTWSQADNLCQNHFHSNIEKNAGGLALLDDETEFDYVRQILGDFNRSATEFGAYIGFSYRNKSWLWLNGREVNFIETPPSVIAANNIIFPYEQQKPCGKVELLRPNDTTILFGLMQQECTKTERALCKIKVDHCFENEQCGIHGVCKNDGTTFDCEYSSEAIQVIAASLFIAIACIIICLCKRSQKYKNNRRRQRRNEQSDKYISTNSSDCLFRGFYRKFIRLFTFSKSPRSEYKKSGIPPPLPNPRPNQTKISKRHRSKPITDGLLTFIQSFITVTVAGISLVYICVQRASSIYNQDLDKSHKNQSTKSYICQIIGNTNSNQNILMLPLSFLLTIFLFIIHTIINSDKKKSFFQNLSFPIIVNPFQKTNRFHTVIVFAIISNQLITLLYEILFSSSLNLHHGILFDLVRRLGLIILYGSRYFPILLSLNIPSFLSTFLTSIFLTCDLLLSVYFEANCVGTLTSLLNLKTRTQIEVTRIHYILMKCLPHYVALGHIIARFYTLTLRHLFIRCKGNSDRWNSSTNSTYNTTSIEYDNDWYYTKSLLINKKRQRSCSNYYFYTQTLYEESNCYQVGYLAYGFVIINYALFILCLLLKILFIHPLLVKIVLKVLAPLIILFALKHIIVYCLTKYFFLRVIRSHRNLKQNIEKQRRNQQDLYNERQDQAIYVDSSNSSTSSPNNDDDDDDDDESHLFTLENRHAYFLFVYFNFFFDCFLGIFSCILRLFKSSIALILYMPRLDYSIFGRSLESIDNGYTAYKSYIYVEALHTHPILITFTQIIYMNILDKRRREKHVLLIDEKQILEQQRRKSIRFRWFLSITLMNNLSLIVTRRHHRKMRNNHSKLNQRTLSDSSLSNRTITIDMCQ